MWASWLVGAIGGLLVVWSVAFVDGLQIDDPVGAVSVHGTCGVWGTLAVGLFYGGKGVFAGGTFSQLLIQAVGAASYAIFTILTCWIAWSIIGGFFGGIRVTEEEELKGLDIGEHGMEAYPDFASAQ